jgi:hypothetical protein
MTTYQAFPFQRRVLEDREQRMFAFPYTYRLCVLFQILDTRYRSRKPSIQESNFLISRREASDIRPIHAPALQDRRDSAVWKEWIMRDGDVVERARVRGIWRRDEDHRAGCWTETRESVGDGIVGDAGYVVSHYCVIPKWK